MSEVSVQLACIQMRSGVEIWIESSKAQKLQDILEGISNHKFIRFETQTFNTADVVGVFLATTMEEHSRRKNGQWKCESGTWHDRAAVCSCPSKADKEKIKLRVQAYENCKLGCIHGMVKTETGMAFCLCQKGLV